MRLPLSHKFILGSLAVSAAVVGFPLAIESLGSPVSPWVMPFVALGAGGSLGFLLSRHLARNHQSVLSLTDRISRGDLRAEIQMPPAGRFQDETHELSRSIASMLENLRELVGHVQVTADRVSSCSQNLEGSIQGANTATEEIAGTVAVMGGADLERWTRALLDRGLFKPGARALAFSYIGPEVTHAIYRDGTIGQAKQHLETTVGGLNDLLAREAGASCHTVVAKSVVTQSSSAIPAIALYISLVFKVMKEKGLHEEAIDQMLRLFRDHVVPDSEPRTDEAGRIRIDDQELREDIQREVRRRWELVGTDSVNEHCDLEGYRADFLRLFGFGVEGVDYSRPVDLDIRL